MREASVGVGCQKLAAMYLGFPAKLNANVENASNPRVLGVRERDFTHSR